MITRDDLNWWLELAPTLEWTFAKTYTETAPHQYVVENRTPGISHDDMIRAARVIATFGRPGKYYSLTKIYLVSPDGRYRWWTEDNQMTDTTLVNRAPTSRSYGVQNAPKTTTLLRQLGEYIGGSTYYDELATFWDEQHPAAAGEAEAIRKALTSVRGQYPPHVLDIGCGTGRVLDLGLASAERYMGIDGSQGMLNMLVRKHPTVARVFPLHIGPHIRFTDSDWSQHLTPGQFDWIFVDAHVALTDDQRTEIATIARRAVISVDGGAWRVDDVTGASTRRIMAEGEALKASA